MSLSINGTEVSSKSDVTYNGDPVKKIICDGSAVWEKVTTEPVTNFISSNITWTMPNTGKDVRGYGGTVGNFPKSGKLNGRLNVYIRKDSIYNHGHWYNAYVQIGGTVVASGISLRMDHTSSDYAGAVFQLNNVAVSAGGIYVAGTIESTTVYYGGIDFSQVTITT